MINGANTAEIKYLVLHAQKVTLFPLLVGLHSPDELDFSTIWLERVSCALRSLKGGTYPSTVVSGRFPCLGGLPMVTLAIQGMQA